MPTMSRPRFANNVSLSISRLRSISTRQIRGIRFTRSTLAFGTFPNRDLAMARVILYLMEAARDDLVRHYWPRPYKIKWIGKAVLKKLIKKVIETHQIVNLPRIIWNIMFIARKGRPQRRTICSQDVIDMFDCILKERDEDGHIIDLDATIGSIPGSSSISQESTWVDISKLVEPHIAIRFELLEDGEEGPGEIYEREYLSSIILPTQSLLDEARRIISQASSSQLMDTE